MAELPEEIVKLIEVTSTYIQDIFDCWIALERWREANGISQREVIQMLRPGDRDFIAHALRLLDLPLMGCTKEELETLR